MYHLIRSELRKYGRVILVAYLSLLLIAYAMYSLPARSLVRSWKVSQTASLYEPGADELIAWYGDTLQVLSPKFSANYAMSMIGSTAIGVILMGMIAAHVVGSEFHWRTLGGQIAHTGRRRLLAGKIILLMMISLGLIVALMLTAAISSLLASRYVSLHLPLASVTAPPIDAMAWPLQMLVTWIGMMLFGVTAMVFTLVTGETVVGLLVYLAVWFGQLVIAGYLQQNPIASFLPAAAQQSVASSAYVYLPGGGIIHEPLVRPIADFAPALAVTIASLVLLTMVATLVFDRQEIR